MKRALLSTWDKTSLAAFARTLADAGVELYSSGGTQRALEEERLPVRDVGSLTGRPEAFGGRMKTLSFEIASALLFERERDAEEARALGIEAIDLVVCNLYPFEEHVRKGCSHDELVEFIDVGGPTMIRAAAKNAKFVTVVVDPADYPRVAEQIVQEGHTSLALRKELAAKAFARTAAYEAAIAAHFAAEAGLAAVYEHRTHAEELRYGENPQQKARVFSPPTKEDALVFEVLGGKQLSYNNYLDLQAALDAIVDLPDASVSVIKHGNPCGLASTGDVGRALELAWAGDPVSAFGSVIASNVELTLAAAKFFALDAEDKTARKFVEIVAAPSFSDEALAYLRQHKSLRILRVQPDSGRRARERRYVRGLLLEQDADHRLFATLEVVSDTPAPEGIESLLRFGQVAVRQVKSNAIVIVEQVSEGACVLLGMGSGQPNRMDSVQLAVRRAKQTLVRAGRPADLGHTMLVSDAFFPFADGVQIALDAGVRLVVQPGGSLRDAEVVAACNRAQASLIFTGTRHFLH